MREGQTRRSPNESFGMDVRGQAPPSCGPKRYCTRVPKQAGL